MSNSGFPIRGQGQYDYIIAGAGCAGLSLLVHLIRSGQFTGRRILLVDRDEKKRNDRTWCFWETEPGLFEPIVRHRWKQVWFHGDKFSGLLPLGPYQYKLISGIKFYDYCFGLIREQPNIEIKFGDVQAIKSREGETSLLLNGEKFTADYIFNSILFKKPALKKKEYYLLQHFKGWMIETQDPIFNSEEATIMDFRTDQRFGTTFVYVMPFSSHRALVEYTLFTENLLRPDEYDQGLREYIRQFLTTASYRISEEESGVIPMTNHQFPGRDNNIISIGTAGGQTKASSGYTFRFIQKHSAAITEQLVQSGNPFIASPAGKKRFRFYDSTLLHILQHKKLSGEKVFTSLFKKNKPQQVLRFLDNESSLKEEIRIISSLPAWPFLKAGLKHL